MNLTIRTKLTACFVVLIVLLAAVSAVTYINLNGISNKSQEVAEVWIVGILKLNEIKENTVNIHSAHLSLLADGTSADTEKQIAAISGDVAEMQSDLQAYEKTIISQEDRDLFAGFTAIWNEYAAMLPAITKAADAGQTDTAKRLIRELDPQYEKLSGQIGAILSLNDRGASEATKQSESLAKVSRTTVLVVSLAALLVAVVLFAVIHRIIADLRRMVVNVTQNAHSLAASSEEISVSANEVASGSMQQAESTVFTAEMVKEMTKAVQSVAQNSGHASELSDDAVKMAAIGEKALHEAMEGMQTISDKINELAGKSAQIGEIIDVIDDIADQTNLLALNAAIEAARAGDAGKGFAVVADEVRKLAERSGKATKEIGQLIKTIQHNTQQSVEAVHTGNDKAEHAGLAFNEITQAIRASSARISEIAAACEELSAQSTDIQNSVQTISSLTQQASAAMEETASASGDIAKMAESLSGAIANIHV
ncbi:MCP four helix bundle domain-containing protein [Paenibacillus athensensis]|uniref:Methyl-accepting transducer domain-containing protein n=1 Tax=Paenibacillus athensensis TaxID=1967502 RepID=A0A4Y8Q6F0_9BACL|nr:methyl-accepting chemotaxis protein [Paenibacillus athensensis]MCD1259727.1 MCP four helix bundle domain-containing protein [Paenibacillus athensensis]